MVMSDLYMKIVGLSTPCLDILPSDPGPYVLVDGEWIRSVSVSVKHLPRCGEGQLLQACAFRYPDGQVSAAPLFFVFDGGSKPKLTWAMLGHPWGSYLFAYAIHDFEWCIVWGAWNSGDISTKDRKRLLKKADRNFRHIHNVIRSEFLEKDGLWERFKNRAKYRAVRGFGRIRGIFSRRD